MIFLKEIDLPFSGSWYLELVITISCRVAVDRTHRAFKLTFVLSIYIANSLMIYFGPMTAPGP
jgi:hypothetical protein